MHKHFQHTWLPVLCRAETATDIVTIGDKGRAQLQRLAPDQIKLSIADTYKERVTFSQVSSKLRLAAMRYSSCHTGTAALTSASISSG